MTPNDIDVLLHCYTSPEPHPRQDAPAVRESIQWFLTEGLIQPEKDRGVYSTTDRGAAHVRQLCALPWPKPAWVDEQGNIIGERD